MSKPPRRSVAGGVYRLGHEPAEDLGASTTAEQRVAMVSELTLRAWRLTGRPFPSYHRAAMPIVIRRPA